MPLRMKLMLCLVGFDVAAAIIFACVGAIGRALFFVGLAFAVWHMVLILEDKIKEINENGR